MIEQINFTIVLGFIFFIGACVLILIFIAPGIIKESVMIITSKNEKTGYVDKSLSNYMEELSRCSNISRIRELVAEIQSQLNNINASATSAAQLKQMESVEKWVVNFSIKEHIKDLKNTNISKQVKFDKVKKDFKLMITNKN